MRFVFAIEGSVFILAVFALLVAVVARIPWRWLRLVCFLLMAVLSPAPLVLIAHAGKRFAAKYPTLATCGWGCVVAVLVGATVLPMVGLWLRWAARTPVARSWRIGWLGLSMCAALKPMAVSIAMLGSGVPTTSHDSRASQLFDCLTRLRPVNRIVAMGTKAGMVYRWGAVPMISG